jgi:hypothetical protein
MKKSAQRGGQQKSEAEENCELCESAGPGWLECREFNKCDNVERQAKNREEALIAKTPAPPLGKILKESAFNTQLGGKRRSRKAKKAKKTKKRRAKKSRKTRTSRR